MNKNLKNVYISPESEIDEELLTFKERILFFEKIKKSPEECGNGWNVTDPRVIKTRSEAESGSNNGLLKEKVFERKSEDINEKQKDVYIDETEENKMRNCEIKNYDGEMEYSEGSKYDEENNSLTNSIHDYVMDLESNVSTIIKELVSSAVTEENKKTEEVGKIKEVGKTEDSSSEYLTIEKNILFENTENLIKEKNKDVNSKNSGKLINEISDYKISEELIKEINDVLMNEKKNNENEMNSIKDNEEGIIDIISGDIDSGNIFNFEKDKTKINEKIADINSENFLDSEVCSETKSDYSTSEVKAKEKKLPHSLQILNNFMTRPKLFSCSPLKQVKNVSSYNLYISCIDKEYLSMPSSITNATPIFSKVHLDNIKTDFRAPGMLLPGRPNITYNNSIISEQGVLLYFKVSSNTISWYIIKKAKDIGDSILKQEIMLKINSMDDATFASFIVSDITTTVFRRTSFIYYNNQVVLLKFIGRSLCVCVNGNCIKMISLENKNFDIRKLNADNRYSFIINKNYQFTCSCLVERNEWYNLVKELSN